MEEPENRSSLDEFVCIGKGPERMLAALSLALCDDRVNAWAERDGAICIAHVFDFTGWNRLPEWASGAALCALFGPWLASAPSMYKGDTPDGSTARGWRISVANRGLPAEVVIEPWTLCYAK